jgi:hypothetical protein
MPLRGGVVQILKMYSFVRIASWKADCGRWVVFLLVKMHFYFDPVQFKQFLVGLIGRILVVVHTAEELKLTGHSGYGTAAPVERLATTQQYPDPVLFKQFPAARIGNVLLLVLTHRQLLKQMALFGSGDMASMVD